MTKTLDNFIKKIKKLANYLILREEEDYLLIGTSIIIKEHKEIGGNIFQPYSKNIDKSVYICFIIALTEDMSNLKEFTKIPILCLTSEEQNYKIDKLKECLDHFIQDEFK